MDIKEYVTKITIEVVWIDPALGTYFPMVRVSGDIPDELDRIKLVQYYIESTHKALRDPSLAETS